MKKIMILGGGINQLGLIHSAKADHYEVLVCDKNPDCIGKKEADLFYCVDIINVNNVYDVAKKENIDGIISNSEVVMEVVAEVSSRLGLIGNTKESISILESKQLFRHFQKQIDLYAPQNRIIKDSSEIEEILKELNYPIVIKPVKCSGTRGTARFDSFVEPDIQNTVKECIRYSRNNLCQIEESVEMPSTVVLEGDIFINKDQIFWGGLFFTKRSEKLPMVPMTYMSPYIDSERHFSIIKNNLSRIFIELGIRHGQYNIEAYFDNADHFFVIEINARQGGHGLPAFIHMATGIDMDRLLITTAVEDNEYFDYVMKEPLHQTYATRHAVFGDEDGIYQGIQISEEIRSYVVAIEEVKKMGDSVEKRVNGSSVIGFVDLVFDSYELQHYYSDHLENYIYPKIKGRNK